MATAFSHLQENLKDHFNFQLKAKTKQAMSTMQCFRILKRLKLQRSACR